MTRLPEATMSERPTNSSRHEASATVLQFEHVAFPRRDNQIAYAMDSLFPMLVRRPRSLSSEDHGGVHASKAEPIGHGVAHPLRPGSLRHEIEPFGRQIRTI